MTFLLLTFLTMQLLLAFIFIGFKLIQAFALMNVAKSIFLQELVAQIMQQNLTHLSIVTILYLFLHQKVQKRSAS